MAPGTQSASSAWWASLYLRPHTQLWLTHQLHTKWERDQHICFICSISATRLIKTLCPNEFVTVDMMWINQRQPSMWLSFTFCSNSTPVRSIWSKTIQCAAPSLTEAWAAVMFWHKVFSDGIYNAHKSACAVVSSEKPSDSHLTLGEALLRLSGQTLATCKILHLFSKFCNTQVSHTIIGLETGMS